MQNIIRMSYFFKTIFKSIFVIIAAFFISRWFEIFLGLKPMPQQVIAIFSKDFFWLTTNLLFLYLLITLFHNYENGKIFSSKNVTLMRNLAYVLIAKEIIPALFLTVSHLNIFFGLTSLNLETLIIAGLLILNSWIMNEGFYLKKDHQLTI